MVFYSKEQNNYTDANGFCSEVLAERFSDRLAENTPLNKLGTATDKDTYTGTGYDVTTYQGKEVDRSGPERIVEVIRTCPAIIIEMGYLSNSSDIVKLTDKDLQKKIGRILFNTVKELFDEYPRVRTD